MADAREVALTVLRRVEIDNAFAAAALTAELSALADPRDAALAFELVHGALRRRSWLDHLLTTVSKKGLKSIDPDVLRILRIAVYQLVFLTRVPARAAVSDAVKRVKKSRAPRLSGLANALLRRIAEMPETVRHPEQVPDDADIATLSIAHGLPQWLLARFDATLGRDTALSVAREFNAPSRRTLRVNAHRLSVEDAIERLGGAADRTPLSPWGLDVRDVRKVSLLVDEGLAAYQDEAAQLAVLALSPRPTDRILDACAGRGGKTAAIGVATQNEATLVATDRAPNKLERLAFELEKQHLNVTTVAQDLTRGAGGIQGAFDKLLLDAPCSGTGTLGRRPEIRWRLAPESVSGLVAIQRSLLNTVAPLVAKGGTLLYVVCSLLPEEGVRQMERFLASHPAFAPLDTPPPGWPDALPWNHGAIRINPATTHTDGYQLVALTKIDD